MLKYVVNMFGSDRIILGSDYPFPLGEMDYPGRLIEETYTPSTHQLLTPPGHTASASITPPTVEDAAAAAKMLEDRDNMLWRNAAAFL